MASGNLTARRWLEEPETHRSGHQMPATFGVMGGFAVMMVLDNALA